MSEPTEDEEISVTQCANLRGQTRSAILYAIKGGSIQARKIGEQYVIKRSDCLAYAGASHGERGKRGAAARWRKPDAIKDEGAP